MLKVIQDFVYNNTVLKLHDVVTPDQFGPGLVPFFIARGLIEESPEMQASEKAEVRAPEEPEPKPEPVKAYTPKKFARKPK